MRKSIYYTILFLLILLFQAFAQARITDRLSGKLIEAQANNNPVRTIVMLNDQVDIVRIDQELYDQKASLEDRAFTVIRTLQDKADQTQPSLVSFLESKPTSELIQYQRFWIVNMIMVEAVPSVIYEIANMPEVWFVDLDGEVDWDKPTDETAATSRANSSEIGLTRINAHKMWELGYTGAGVIVMNIDTGVDGNHPALSARWRGNQPGIPDSVAWFHPNGSSSYPFDTGSHGTHTMGIMTGLDPVTNDTVGAAFGAQWIAALTIGASGDFQTNNIASYQWAMDPDGNPGTTDDMPIAIGCSWQDPYVSDCDALYEMTFNSVEAAGIAIVFSAGNAGGTHGSSTITRPKNINTTLVNSWATGGVDGNNPNLPAYNSTSKGPSRCGGTGSLLIKPEACAPAVSVRSAVPGSSYGNKTGTSMACPHVVGAIALLKEAHPTLTGHELKMALYLTAQETPSDTYPGEDNTFGMGIIDVYAAHMSLADPDDPNAPEGLSAYSDYTTPTSINLSWTDPTTYVNGDPLNNFQIKVYRDSVFVTNVASGIETYNDMGLNDGQEYDYVLYAADIPNDSLSIPVEVSWYAGGNPVPGPPTALSLISAGGGDLMAHWTNPYTNMDGTPMDDFDAINLYEDGTLLTTFTRSPGDTGSADSAVFTPGGVNLPYYVAAVDNESPANESTPSGTAYPPFAAPYTQDFELGGVLPPLWANKTDDDFDWTVDAGGTNSSGTGPTVDHTTGTAQGYYVYTETSSPVAAGDVAHLTTPFIDLSNVSQPGMAFWYHMHGAAMGELHVDVHANGQWNLDVIPPFIGQQQPNQTDPYLQAVVDLSNYAVSPVQVRFRGICGTSFTSDMAIDDVFFGSLAANPQMTVAPLSVGDTLLVGETSMFPVVVSNIAAVPAALNYTVTENPSVSWLSVVPTSGTVTSGQKDTLNVTLDATGLSAGMHNTELIFTGNDTTNMADTIDVTLEVNDAPIISINPDTFDVVVASGNTEIDTLTIRNDGAGPLYFTVEPGQPLDRSLITGKPQAAKVDQTTLSPEFLAAMERRSSQPGVVNAIDELQSNSSSSGITMPDQILGEEIFGSTANPFSGPNRDRGNIFSVTNATTLIEHRFYLDITASTELILFVYEGTAVTGTYNKIDEVFYANSGSGAAFYTSGPINVPLEVGKYYYIGASWLGDAEYYRSSDPTPIPTSFGMLETGIPGNIAGGYPPGATANNTYSSGGFSPYYCAIVTGVGIDWLSANPDSGMVAPGDSMDIKVTFDPTGLLGGDYYADVVINSNDPLNPEVRAGTHMFVQMDITNIFYPDPLIFDTTFVNGTTTVAGKIFNYGAGVLDVADIQSTNPVFSVDTTSFQVPPLDSFQVNVSFSPTSVGTKTGWLIVISNDPNAPIDSVWVEGVAVQSTGIADLTELPTKFGVAPNYPNPFNPTTTIKYQLPRTSDVKLVIYNVLGQKIRTLVNARIEAGYHSVEWDGNNELGVQAASGIYIYQFQAEDYLKIQKMILMK